MHNALFKYVCTIITNSLVFDALKNCIQLKIKKDRPDNYNKFKASRFLVSIKNWQILKINTILQKTKK